MVGVDIGDLSDAVFVGPTWDPEQGWLAAFVSRYGDSFALGLPELELRILYMEREGRGTAEEKKALEVLERERFHP